MAKNKEAMGAPWFKPVVHKVEDEPQVFEFGRREGVYLENQTNSVSIFSLFDRQK